MNWREESCRWAKTGGKFTAGYLNWWEQDLFLGGIIFLAGRWTDPKCLACYFCIFAAAEGGQVESVASADGMCGESSLCESFLCESFLCESSLCESFLCVIFCESFLCESFLCHGGFCCSAGQPAFFFCSM